MNQQDQLTANIVRYIQQLAVNPEQPEIYFQLGNLYVKKQQWQLAIKSYEQAIKFNPQLITAYCYLAKIYEKKINNYDESANYWYQAIQLNPDWLTADTCNSLGNILKKQKKFKQAIDCHQKAINLNSNLLDSYHKLFELFMIQNQDQEAIQIYREGVQYNSQDSQFHFALAQALAQQNKWKLAEQSYQDAIALEPNFPSELAISLDFKTNRWQAYHQLGKVLQYKKQWQIAITLYQKVNELEPNFIPAYIRIANIYRSLEQYQLAFHYYRQAIIISPQDNPLHHQAVQSYQNTLKSLSNPQAQLYYQWGKLLRSQGLFDQAIAAYQEAIKIDPKFELAYIDIQYTEVNNSQLEQLINFYRQIVKDCSYPLAWGNLGDALTQQGKIQEAISCYQTSAYQKAIQKDPHLAQLNWPQKKEKMPDFLIVGATKCGTSSLYYYLSHHPQILFSHKKELNFFRKDFQRGIDWYLSHFPTITDRSNFLTGEATPNYLRFPIVAQRIQKYCPNSKLIILLRNPVERAISWHYHKKNTGLINDNLEQAIKKELKLLQTLGESDIMNIGFNDPDNIIASLYYYQIKAWMKHLPRQQFLILKSEDFYSSPENTMEQVFSFLGLPVHKIDQYPKINAGFYSSVDPDLRKTLSEYFQPYNKLLEEYLNCNFHWQ
ncbi:MAG: tetratricopeptide repeat protein [Xenococcus sp. (in: cyanobacteria)]